MSEQPVIERKLAGDYRIEFSVQRFDEAEGDFVEVGFGSSGGCGTVNDAAYAVESLVQNRQWETSAGMPDPEEA